MSDAVLIRPISADEFAPFGDVLSCDGTPSALINQGNCERYTDLATLDFQDGTAGISLFDARPRQLPYRLDMVERHPRGSQAFIPMNTAPFLAIVAEGADAEPGRVHAFEVPVGTGINLHRNVWHGVLTPLHAPGLFAVIDRIGPGDNLEEYWFDTPLTVRAAP